MPAQKFLQLVSGRITEVFATVVSAGAADDGKLIGLNAQGRLDNSVLPTGIGAETKNINATEALAAGDYVNIYDAGAGAFGVRKADATTAKPADGFVLAAVANAAAATVYTEGINNAVTGQTPGTVFLSTTAGRGGSTIPTVAGQIVQDIGIALSATEVAFSRTSPIVRA